MDNLTLAELDRDGALCDAIETISGSRADLLRTAAGGAAAFLGLLAVPVERSRRRRPTPRSSTTS